MNRMMRAGKSLRFAATMMFAVVVAASVAGCDGTSSTSTPSSTIGAAAAATATTSAQQSAGATAQQDSQYYGWRHHALLMFSAANYAAAQSDGSVSLRVSRMGMASAAVTVNYSTADGTAVAGTDYTAAGGTLAWAENDSTAKTITVRISNATPYLGAKSFKVALSNPSTAAHIANPGTATVTISGDGVAAIGDLQLAASSYTVGQGAGALTVTVNRSQGSSGSISVAYGTTNGSAVAGTDFTAASGSLDWADGDSAPKTFSVAVSNAHPFSGTKSFSVALSDPKSGAALGSPSSAAVTITGDASAPVGSLNLAAANSTVSQSAGTVPVIVDRTGGSSGAVSVAYTTSNGTAMAGANYAATSGTLSWTDGDAKPKTFSVAIMNTTPFTGSKAFTVALSGPSGGATISNPGSASVTINGDASAAVGSIELSAASVAVLQSAGSVAVSVTRSGGSAGAVSVAYATVSGTAVAGTDFTASSGTLNWADGDAAAKTVSIPISNATPFAGAKSFTVTLSGATGGATLASPSSAIVAISGDAVSAVGSVQLSASSDAVLQSAGSVSLTVNRTGGSSGAVSVAYATANGTAVSGTDFTAASGTLNWADGDAASKTMSVAISNATPFSGSKSFSVALSSPTGGATLATPSSATVTISGSSSGSGGGGSGGPAAPTNFLLTNEGANSETLSWSAASGAASYKIYRNGTAYASTSATTYTDTAATNATVPTFAAPATIYSYTVSAVDASGNEGPQATNLTYWVYHNGGYFWGAGGTNDYSDVTANYKDTAGIPESGSYDIAIASKPGGYYQPFSGGTASPEWAAEIGAFKYMILDLKPTIANQKWRLNIISRLPQGDVYNNAPVTLPGNYGPAPVVGQWATYKVPLNPDLAVGTGSFVGSISGSTLTVTAVNPGMSVQTTAWLTGPGIAADTTINSFGSGNGGVGTYNLNKSASVPAGTTINMQRTNMYKFSLTDDGGSANTYYIDNVGFTVN
jgi:hypothetical protein